MDQQELLELVGAPKIVLLLICRGILILEGTRITVGYCRFSYAETGNYSIYLSGQKIITTISVVIQE